MSESTLTPDLRDLVYNQPYLSIVPDESSQLPSETLLRAISSSSLFPVQENGDVAPKKQRKFALNLRPTSSKQQNRFQQSESNSRVGNLSSVESESIVVVLTPDLTGKVFVSRRIELAEGSEIQVWNGIGFDTIIQL